MDFDLGEGLCVRETGRGTNRIMISVRIYDRTYVGAVCCSVLKNRAGVTTKWVWVDVVDRQELTDDQRTAVESFLVKQKEIFSGTNFGGHA
jgi:hypothetical protein